MKRGRFAKQWSPTPKAGTVTSRCSGTLAGVVGNLKVACTASFKTFSKRLFNSNARNDVRRKGKTMIQPRSNAIEDKIRELKEMSEAHAKLIEQLELSIQLEQLWPKAFEHGSCKSKWESRSSATNGRPTHDTCCYFTITRSDGSTYSIPWNDVPDFFKHDEAKRRGINATTEPKSTKLNDLVSMGLYRFVKRNARKDV